MIKVQVLLSMQDDRDFLADQIDSLIWQELKPWRYVMRDAGSRDDSVEIAHRYDLRIAPQVIAARRSSPAVAVASLLSLAANGADYYALCGGDDIWHEHKLQRAVQRLESHVGERPAMYCARARIVAANAGAIGTTPDFPERLSLLRLLFEAAPIGPTIVLNRAARRLVHAHDLSAAPYWPWAAALFVAAAGGSVYFDREPVMDLRVYRGKAAAIHEGKPDPACAQRVDHTRAFALLARHCAMLRAEPERIDIHAKQILDNLEASAGSGKIARRVLANHRDLDAGPFWRTLRLKRAVRRGKAAA